MCLEHRLRVSSLFSSGSHISECPAEMDSVLLEKWLGTYAQLKPELMKMPCLWNFYISAAWGLLLSGGLVVLTVAIARGE